MFPEIAYYGISLRSRTTGAYAATYQYLGLVNSTVNYNHNDGVHAFEIAYGASAANQMLYFSGDTISSGNQGNGVYAVSIAVDQSFTEQYVLFGYKSGAITYVTNNGGDGIYAGVAAFSGASAEQNVLVYNTTATGNQGSGLAVGAAANGFGFGSSYIYYSHVSQNVIAAYDTFDHNQGRRQRVELAMCSIMAALLRPARRSLSCRYELGNTGAGFYETTHLTSIRGNSFSFSTNITSDLYLINDTASNNGANGIDIRSYANGAVYAPAFFGGYNYMEMHNQITGTTANGNGGSGLSVMTNTSGRYTLNAEYFTISGSTFDNNHGDGALFQSTDYYGPGGFGVSLQQVTISGSDFSGNGEEGINISAFASGNQGRAEQHFTIADSTFDHNGGDGVFIYASAVNGVYVAGHPCDTAQGLPGGCAFVRQSVVIQGSDISYNGNDGINVVTYANNYGADLLGASGRPHAPTLEVPMALTVDGNDNHGLNA